MKQCCTSTPAACKALPAVGAVAACPGSHVGAGLCRCCAERPLQSHLEPPALCPAIFPGCVSYLGMGCIPVPVWDSPEAAGPRTVQRILSAS